MARVSIFKGRRSNLRHDFELGLENGVRMDKEEISYCQKCNVWGRNQIQNVYVRCLGWSAIHIGCVVVRLLRIHSCGRTMTAVVDGVPILRNSGK